MSKITVTTRHTGLGTEPEETVIEFDTPEAARNAAMSYALTANNPEVTTIILSGKTVAAFNKQDIVRLVQE